MGMVIRSEGRDRFAAYIGELTKVIGHADRVKPLRTIVVGCWPRRTGGAWSRWRR